jgi:hypothetical protein
MYLYGEGWDFGEVAGDRRFIQATQVNMAGTGIGTFSDRIRDAARGGGPFDSGRRTSATRASSAAAATIPTTSTVRRRCLRDAGALLAADQLRATMAGSIRTFTSRTAAARLVTGADIPYGGAPTGYVDDPEEVINYVEAHDNETLWDVSQYKHPAYAERGGPRAGPECRRQRGDARSGRSVRPCGPGTAALEVFRPRQLRPHGLVQQARLHLPGQQLGGRTAGPREEPGPAGRRSRRPCRTRRRWSRRHRSSSPTSTSRRCCGSASRRCCSGCARPAISTRACSSSTPAPRSASA